MKKHLKEKWTMQMEEKAPPIDLKEFRRIQRTYTEMIKVSLKELGEKGGSTTEAIDEHIRQYHRQDVHEHHNNYLSTFLNDLIGSKVVVRMPGDRYALHPSQERLLTDNSRAKLDQGGGEKVTSANVAESLALDVPRRERSKRIATDLATISSKKTRQ